jgi:hypothetical protein
MLTFKPLKTKALIIQGKIRRKRRFLNAGILSLNCRLKRRHSMPTQKICLMNYFSQKLHFHTPYWSVNVMSNKEINVIQFHIRYRAV